MVAKLEKVNNVTSFSEEYQGRAGDWLPMAMVSTSNSLAGTTAAHGAIHQLEKGTNGGKAGVVLCKTSSLGFFRRNWQVCDREVLGKVFSKALKKETSTAGVSGSSGTVKGWYEESKSTAGFQRGGSRDLCWRQGWKKRWRTRSWCWWFLMGM